MSVICPVSKLVEFTGLELLEDVTPPEFVARLYLDSDPNCPVFGNLKFFYGGEGSIMNMTTDEILELLG